MPDATRIGNLLAAAQNCTDILGNEVTEVLQGIMAPGLLTAPGAVQDVAALLLIIEESMEVYRNATAQTTVTVPLARSTPEKNRVVRRDHKSADSGPRGTGDESIDDGAPDGGGGHYGASGPYSSADLHDSADEFDGRESIR